MAEIIELAARRKQESSPEEAYGLRKFVARVTKTSKFPPIYKVEYYDPTKQRQWLLAHPSASFGTTVKFLDRFKMWAYSISLEWVLEDPSGNFQGYASPHRPLSRVMVMSPAEPEGTVLYLPGYPVALPPHS
jgi:hypothetical protein